MNNSRTRSKKFTRPDAPLRQRWGGIHVSVALMTGVVGLAIGVVATRQQSAVKPETEGAETATQTLTNQQRFDALTGNELEELRNRQKRFEQFPLPRQEHLRSVHEQWLSHPDRDELLETMKQYTEWLKSLKAEQRAKIKSLSGEERINLVSEIRREQAEAIFGIAGETQLPKEDVSVLFEWSKEFLESRKSEIAELFRIREPSSDGRRGRGGGGNRGFEPRPEMLFLSLGRNSLDDVVALIQESDIARLSSQLSPEAVAIIESQGKTADKQKLIFRWIVSALEALRNPEVPQRDLEEFFDTEMSTEQRQRVESMTPESRLRAIRSFYYSRNRQRLAPGMFPSPGSPDFRTPRDSDKDKDGPLSPDRL